MSQYPCHVRSGEKSPVYLTFLFLFGCQGTKKLLFITVHQSIILHIDDTRIVICLIDTDYLTLTFEHSTCIKIPVEEFDLKTISFTYGDAFPVFSDARHKMDDKEYRRKLYVYDEILELIAKYGLPQNWNDDGVHGPERYIEAHIWSDETIDRYR